VTKNQTEDLFSADLFGEENQEQDIQVEPDTKALENETSASVAQTVEADAESTQESSAQEEQAEEARLETEEIAETEPEAQTPTPIPIEARPVLSGDDGEQLTLAHFASHAYLEYAMSVVKGRALPAIGDGQKPVQRRILYAMHEIGLGRADAKTVKSARVVGDVLAKFHPHGDTAVYDAMVRMAQDFNMRYPLVLGQGNFGSRDGDGAAAMRYTEARLTKISRLLLEEIDEGTVDFMSNYDGVFQEPEMLPARLPFVLLNGSSGIAVGMATEIPSHNIKEVAAACLMLLDKPEATLDDILSVLPAPDFPMGGQLISKKDDIREAYRTGRGTLKVRARYSFEEMQRGHWRLVVTELPPNSSAQRVLNEVGEITNPKIRPGKKTLSAEQQQAKAAMLALLDSVRDESARTTPTRLVFEPKSKNINRDEFVNALLAQTSLESNVSLNLVMVGSDGKPSQKSLVEILNEWLAFRMQTVRRRTQFRLDRTLERIHIMEGRHLVYLNLDEVIAIIRESDDPKQALLARFPLSEVQVEDILEIRLRQLARLVGIKIEAELAELNKTKQSLERLLGSEKLMRNLLAKEIAQDAAEFGDERRTLIEEASRAEMTQTVVDEPVTVVISQKGYVRSRSGHGHDATVMTYKMGDAFGVAFECRTTDQMVAVSDTGRVYTIAVSDLPSARGDGLPLNSFIDLEKGSSIIGYCVAKPQDRIVMATSEGMGFVCQFKDLLARVRAGKNFIKVDEKGVKVLVPQVVREGQSLLACLSEEGRLLIYDLNEVRVLPGGGKGVVLMDLNLNESLVLAKPIDAEGVLVTGIGRGGKEREYAVKKAVLEYHMGHRARKGKALDIRWKATDLKPLPKKEGGNQEHEEKTEEVSDTLF
jgi:topoisomerase-4 subunit A